MFRGSKWAIGVVALMLVAGPLLAQDEAAEKPKRERPAKAEGAGKDAAGKNNLKGEYAIMASVLKLDEAQQVKLKAACDAKTAALEEWTKANAEKLKELQTQVKAAEKGSDEAKQLSEQLKALNAEKAKIEQEKQAEILAVLTPEQQLQWTAFTLNRTLLQKYSKLELTEEQKAKIKELADKAAVEQSKAEDPKAKALVAGALEKQVMETVLTEEQKAKLPAAKPGKTQGERPAREKPAKEEAAE